jgi:hypothetical protein
MGTNGHEWVSDIGEMVMHVKAQWVLTAVVGVAAGLLAMEARTSVLAQGGAPDGLGQETARIGAALQRAAEVAGPCYARYTGPANDPKANPPQRWDEIIW